MSVHKSPVRLKDIAEKSGFSIGTVQRALSNTGGYSPESMSLGLIAADIFSVAHKEATGSVLLLGGDRNQSRQANRATDFCKAMAVRCPNLSIIELHAFNNPENLHHLLSHSLRDIPMLKGLYAVSSRETRAMCLAIQQAGLSGQITAVGTDVFPALLPYFEDDTLTASIYQYPIKRGYLSVKTVIEHLLGNELSAYRDLMPVAPVFKSTASAFCSMEIF